MIRESLLELLCAPGSHALLRLADAAELSEINRRIQSGTIRNHSGSILETPLEGSLLCLSEQSGYPIRDGLPVLLPGEAFNWPGELSGK